MNTEPLIFLDLDDTVFQTARKMTAAEADKAQAVAFDSGGKPSSWMTQKQRFFFDWLNANGRLIPVTGRGTEQLARVRLTFHSWKIACHGAVIMDADNNILQSWQQKMRALTEPFLPGLLRLRDACQLFCEQRNYRIAARLIHENGFPFYMTLKHSDPGRLDELAAILPWLAGREESTTYGIFHNDNNISIMPRPLGKARAVREVLRHMPDAPSLGFGDSLSDLSFLFLCDWLGMPQKSQICQSLRP